MGKAKYHLYKRRKVTVNQYMDMTPVKLARTTVVRMLRKGMTLDEIDKKYTLTATGFNTGVSIIMREEEEKDAEKERIIKIMSVPINPKKTQNYYMSKTPLRGDEVEPIRLKQNAFTIGY